MKLTQRRIDDLTCPPDRRDMLVFDDEVRGLAVRTTASGSKSFLVQYSFHGNKRRHPLGSGLKLAAARAAAQAVLGEVALGRDPAKERKDRTRAAKNTPTLGAVVDDWEAIHLKDRRESYRTEATRTIRRVFASLLKRPATELDHTAILPALDQLHREGKPAMARLAAVYASSCCAWAKKRRTITVNPFADLPQAPAVAACGGRP
jgi:hypothetical protein